MDSNKKNVCNNIFMCISFADSCVRLSTCILTVKHNNYQRMIINGTVEWCSDPKGMVAHKNHVSLLIALLFKTIYKKIHFRIKRLKTRYTLLT